MMDQLFCDGPAPFGDTCGRPVAGHGKGKCSTHLRQLNRTGKMQPIEEELSPTERLLKALNAWNEADSDEEYEAAFRTVIANTKNVSRKEVQETVRRALASARAKGVRLGRPPKVDGRAVRHLYEMVGSTEIVAKMLDVSARTIRRHVHRTKSRFMSDIDAPGPRLVPVFS